MVQNIYNHWALKYAGVISKIHWQRGGVFPLTQVHVQFLFVHVYKILSILTLNMQNLSTLHISKHVVGSSIFYFAISWSVPICPYMYSKQLFAGARLFSLNYKDKGLQ